MREWILDFLILDDIVLPFFFHIKWENFSSQNCIFKIIFLKI